MNAARMRTDRMTKGDKFSCFFAKIFSSLYFVAFFFMGDIGWVLYNKFSISPIDPPPFEMKNSFVSDMTLFIDLIIIMVQRRITAIEIKKTQEIYNMEKDTHNDMDHVLNILNDIKSKYLEGKK